MGIASVLAVPVRSSRIGAGAVSYQAGVTFRVWVKLAQLVTAVVDCNGWKAIGDSLIPDGGTE